MITDDLVAYIQTQLKKNTSKDLITSRLSQAGWRMEDIEQGWIAVEKTQTSQSFTATENKNESKITTDAYREQPESLSVKQAVAPMTTPKQEPVASTLSEPKVWTPKTLQSLDMTEPSLQEPVLSSSKTAAQVKPVVYVVPPKTPVSDLLEGQDDPESETDLIASLIPKVPQVITEGNGKIFKPMVAPVVPQVSNIPASPMMPRDPFRELSPLTKEVDVVADISVTQPPTQTTPKESTLPNTFGEINKPRMETPLESTQPLIERVQPGIETKNPIIDSFSKRAMISSYANDVSSVQTPTQAPHVQISQKTMKWGIIGLLVLIISGTSLAMIGGYIQFPSLVREDPKNVLANSSAYLSSLKSYKSQTVISLSIPSIANITNGLVSGETVQSQDMESILINLSASINQATPLSPKTSKFDATAKSSLLKSDITSTLIYDGTTSYIDIPELTEIFGTDAPRKGMVAVKDGELSLLVPQLPEGIQELVKRADAYDILSKGVPVYAKQETKDAVSSFIQEVKINQKGKETIKGVVTYHYQIIPTRAATKELLTRLADTFVVALPVEAQKDLDEGLGSVVFDSFDVWIGKNDSAIHQYEFTLSAPLSKALALNDSGIAGKQVQLSFKKTYFDFDVQNDIAVPLNVSTVSGFSNSIRDAKMRSSIASLKTAAKSLSNAAGGYGKISNSNGSCTSPSSGSLFSPTGHPKGASTQVGVIAETLQEFLSATNNEGVCYSTASAWAVQAPLASDPASYYCADSTGALITLATTIKGPICK